MKKHSILDTVKKKVQQSNSINLYNSITMLLGCQSATEDSCLNSLTRYLHASTSNLLGCGHYRCTSCMTMKLLTQQVALVLKSDLIAPFSTFCVFSPSWSHLSIFFCSVLSTELLARGIVDFTVSFHCVICFCFWNPKQESLWLSKCKFLNQTLENWVIYHITQAKFLILRFVFWLWILYSVAFGWPFCRMSLDLRSTLKITL